MAGGIKVGNNKFVSMTTDFGHSAIGRLGGRKVQVGQGAKPRLKFGEIHKEVGIRARLANWMTPKGRRVESKVLAGLGDFGKSVGNTLGSLIPREDGKPDVKNLLKDLASLRKEAVPLTKRGTDYQELLKTRVGMELTRFSEKGLKNLLTSLESREMGDLLTSLDQGPDPELHRVMDAVGEGETLEEESRVENGMAQDLRTLHGLVQNDANRRMGKLLGDYRLVVRNFLEDSEDPTEDPRMFVDQLDDVHLALRKLTAQAERVGMPLPEEVRQLWDHLEDFLGHLGDRCLEMLDDFLKNPVDSSENPDGFCRQVGKAMTLVASLERVERKTGREVPEGMGERLQGIRESLAGLSPENLSTAFLEPRNVHRLGLAMHRFDLRQMDAGLTNRANSLRGGFREDYEDSLDSCLRSLKDGNFTGALQDLEVLFQEGLIGLKLHQDLGGDSEGTDQLIPLKAGWMETALNGMNTETLLEVAQALHSPDGVHFQEALYNAGMAMNSVLGGRELSNAMITRFSDLEVLGQLLEARLGRDNVEMPERSASPEDPTNNMPLEVPNALKDAFGVETRGQEWRWARSGPDVDLTSGKVSSGVWMALDRLSEPKPDPIDLIQAGFGLDQRVRTRHPELEDPQERHDYLKRKIKDVLADASPVQLRLAQGKFTYMQSNNLIHNLVLALENAPENTSQEKRKALADLVSSSQVLKVLEEALAEALVERNMEPLTLQEGQGIGPPTPLTLQGMEEAIRQFEARESVPLEHRSDGALEGTSLQMFETLWNGPKGGQTTGRQLDSQGRDMGICPALYKDSFRAHFTLREGNETRPLFRQGPEDEEMTRTGVQDLLRFCGNDPDLVFTVSKVINQNTVAPFIAGMAFTSPDSPFALPDGQKPHPGYLRQRSDYDLSKDQEGNIQIRMRARFTLDKIDLEDGRSIPLETENSHISMDLHIQVSKDGQVTHGPVNYDYQINRGTDLFG